MTLKIDSLFKTKANVPRVSWRVDLDTLSNEPCSGLLVVIPPQSDQTVGTSVYFWTKPAAVVGCTVRLRWLVKVLCWCFLLSVFTSGDFVGFFLHVNCNIWANEWWERSHVTCVGAFWFVSPTYQPSSRTWTNIVVKHKRLKNAPTYNILPLVPTKWSELQMWKQSNSFIFSPQTSKKWKIENTSCITSPDCNHLLKWVQQRNPVEALPNVTLCNKSWLFLCRTSELLWAQWSAQSCSRNVQPQGINWRWWLLLKRKCSVSVNNNMSHCVLMLFSCASGFPWWPHSRWEHISSKIGSVSSATGSFSSIHDFNQVGWFSRGSFIHTPSVIRYSIYPDLFKLWKCKAYVAVPHLVSFGHPSGHNQLDHPAFVPLRRHGLS